MNALAEISKAERALQQATDIIDILDLRDMCTGIQALVHAIDAGYELQQRATIMRLKCERKAGQWLGDNLQRGGSQPVTLSMVEVAKWQSSRWQAFASLDEQRFNTWVDEHLARGWDVTAAGLLRYANNVEAKMNGRPSNQLLLAPSQKVCWLKGFMVRCDGGLQGGHIIHKGEVQGNKDARAILAACPPEIMAPQCVAHNVNRFANNREAKRIQLLQKIYQYGYVHMANWFFVFHKTFKVPRHELMLEVLLEPQANKL